MTFTEAAAEVLRLAGKPLHYKEITELAIEKNLLSHVGKSPEVTMGARLAALLKKEDKTNPIVRIKPGVFGLREWDDKKKRGGASAAREEEESSGEDINALEVEAAAARPAARGGDFGDEEDDDGGEVSGEDALRADLAAQGAEMFDDEDDDDQPILAAPASAGSPASVGGAALEGGPGGEGGRRRRRRRRRGRGGSAFGEDRASAPRMNEGNGGAAGTYSAPSLSGEGGLDGMADPNRDPLAPAPRPMIRERHQIMAGGAPSGIDIPAGEGEELAGKELADAALAVLASFDRNAGPVPMRALLEGVMRRGRLSGDPSLAGIQLNAALRGDNLRRLAAGSRPRFRFATGARVAPTDWALGGDLARLEQDVMSAVERYREASRRFMLRRVQELPGPSFVELALVVLERCGLTQIRPVRRAGAPGGEAHFAAVHRTGSDEIRTAIVIRKDGREIGRERVSDLRGALHHYGPAAAGWLITTGQVLSGAKEEAAAQNAAPVALYDGVSLCRLLEESDVAVVRAKFPIAIPDLDFLDTLRGMNRLGVLALFAFAFALVEASAYAAKAAPKKPSAEPLSVELVSTDKAKWTVRLRNTASAARRVVLDARLVALEVYSAKKAARPVVCELPADMRPDEDEAGSLQLEPNQAALVDFDPRLFCFSEAQATALQKAARVGVRYSLFGGPKVTGEAIVPSAASIPSVRPSSSSDDAADEKTDKPQAAPAPDVDKESAGDVTVAAPPRIDGATAATVAMNVTVTSTAQSVKRAFFRPGSIGFVVEGPTGAFSCPVKGVPPIPELESGLAPGRKARVDVLLGPTCLGRSFDRPGLYVVRPVFASRVPPWQSGASLAGERLGAPSLVRIRDARRPLVLPPVRVE